jgi:hypothetical protein
VIFKGRLVGESNACRSKRKKSIDGTIEKSDEHRFLCTKGIPDPQTLHLCYLSYKEQACNNNFIDTIVEGPKRRHPK